MHCPECSHALIPEQLELITVDRCASCSGVWFDAGELETFRMSIEGAEAPESILPRFSPNPRLSCGPCPRCESDELQIGSVGERAIGVCGRCSGIFVSGDELKQFSKSRARRIAEAGAGGVAEAASSAPDLVLELLAGLFSGF